MANVVLSWLSSEHFHVVLMLVLMLTADVFPQTLRQLLLPSDGSPLCAVEAPSFIVSIPAFWTYQVTSSVNTQVPSCVPDTLKCAWICKQDRNCTSFNYNQTLLQCELYYYRPLNYAPSQDCQHYWASVRNKFFSASLIVYQSDCLTVCLPICLYTSLSAYQSRGVNPGGLRGSRPPDFGQGGRGGVAGGSQRGL